MYFDHSATTPVHPDVQNLINITQKEVYGNPSSTYSPGKNARVLLEKSREQVAKSINTTPAKIIFNSTQIPRLNMIESYFSILKNIA